MNDADRYLERPIIIIGAPRSGTTLLGRILCHHRSLAYAHEPRTVWRYGNDRRSDMLSPEHARDEVIQYIRGYFTAFVRDAGATRLLEKTPSNSLRPEFVERILPGCRFIHIMRSPIDAVLSTYRSWTNRACGMEAVNLVKFRKRMSEISVRQLPLYTKEIIHRLAPELIVRVLGQSIWGPRLPGIDGLLRDLEVLDVCALQWRMSVETAIHFGRRLPCDRYLEIWLEDLSPELFHRVLAFCELDNHEEMLRVFDQNYRPESASSRRAEAHPADTDRILRWIEPTISLVGHRPDFETPPVSPGAPPRLSGEC